MGVASGTGVDRVAVGDLSVAFRAAGAGGLVVLIHGLGQDHGIWGSIQDAWRDARTIAYDVRGHGSTTLGEPEGTLAQLGRDLVGLLERVGPATCVGFSLGGSIALWAASERPDLVSAVVAVATSSVVGRVAADAMGKRIDQVWAGGLERLRGVLASDTRSQLAGDESRLSEIVAARVAATAGVEGYLNGARAVRDMRDHPLQERLSSIGQPVLVVNGSRDPWCPRRAAEIMLEALPNAWFVELEDVGHLVTDVAPGELLERIRVWTEERGEG